MIIRKILPSDDAQVAALIRSVMTDYNCVGEGYSIEDEEVDIMSRAYSAGKSIYYVIDDNGHILGGAGIAPLDGGDADTCELKKMYFYTEARGKGMGRKVMQMLLNDAVELGYSKCYLETVNRMTAANAMYAKFGFRKLQSQMGGTGHSGCDTFYLKDL